MLISILAALALSVPQDAPADPTAEALAELRVRTRARCETHPRNPDETVEVCAARRATALIATYGSAVAAVSATDGWDRPARPDTGGPNFPTLTDALGASPDRGRTNAAPTGTWQPPQPRCRRETTRSEDGTSASATLICGNNPEAQRNAREALDRVLSPD